MTSAVTWKDAWANALEAARAKLPDDKKSEKHLKLVASAHKDALESIHAAYLDGKIDDVTFESALAEERRIMRAALQAPVIGPKKGSAAAKAFFRALEGVAGA
jgi:hypothetical protein